jgi:uncharacterized glyoxalase superfamily protein PhnB
MKATSVVPELSVRHGRAAVDFYIRAFGAVASGAVLVDPVSDGHGWRLGRVRDPYGYQWEVGKPLRPWPPTHGEPD